MNNQEIVLRIEDYHRELKVPDEVQSEWEIWNASRPISGHWTWIDQDGARGWFLAAINPNLPDAEYHRERCRQLAAFQLVKIPRAAIERWGQAKCAEYGMDYDELDFNDIVHSFYMNWEDGRIDLAQLIN